MADGELLIFLMVLVFNTIILEIGLVSICNHLRDIKEELKRRNDNG